MCTYETAKVAYIFVKRQHVQKTFTAYLFTVALELYPRLFTLRMGSVGVRLFSGESVCLSPLSRRGGWSVSIPFMQSGHRHHLLSSMGRWM